MLVMDAISLRLRVLLHIVIDDVFERLIHKIDGLITVHLSQLILPTIVVKQLDGFVEVDDEAPAHGFSGIVSALIELASIQITPVCHCRGAKFSVVHVLICLAEEPAGKSLE